MADPKHVAAVKEGRPSLQDFLGQHPGVQLDLSGADFSDTGSLLAGCNLKGANLRGAKLSDLELTNIQLDCADLTEANLEATELTRAHLQGANLTLAKLAKADFSGANCRGACFRNAEMTGANVQEATKNPDAGLKADFSHADFSGADLTGVQLPNSNFVGAKFVKANLYSANFSGSAIPQADFTDSDLTQTNFNDCSAIKTTWNRATGSPNLGNARLRGASFAHVTFSGANFGSSILEDATIRSAKLKTCYFDQAQLTNADIRGSDFLESRFNNVEMRLVKNAHLAKNLERTHVQSPDHDVKHFDECVRPWRNKTCSWERIRVVGRLPLFGLSTSLLIFLPILFYTVDIYNNKVSILRQWSERLALENSEALRSLAESLQERLHPFFLDWSTIALFASTVSLLLASLLFSCCPNTIKDLSREQWVYELGRSLLHYWPPAWRTPYLRIPCAVLYAVGGLLGLMVLFVKLGDALFVMLRNIRL